MYSNIKKKKEANITMFVRVIIYTGRDHIIANIGLSLIEDHTIYHP